MDVLLINAIAYTLLFSYTLHKYKRLNVYNIVILFNTIVAILGYVTTKQGIQLVGSSNFGEHAPLIPYICLFVSILLITSPLKQVSSDKIDINILDNSIFKKFIIFSVFVYIIVNIVLLYEFTLVIQQGFAEAYLSRRLEGRSVVEFNNPVLNFFSTKGGSYVTATFPILIFYFFYQLIRKKIKTWKCITGMLLCFSPQILESLNAGSKGMLFFCATDILFFYFIFEKLLSARIKKGFFLLGIGSGLLMLTYAISIQVSRNEASSSDKLASEVMLRYFGEPMPNLGDLYDDVQNHPYGKRFFRTILEPDKFDNTEDERLYWTKYTHTRVDNFKTIWGDSFIEFGFIGSFIFLYLVVFLYKRYVFSKSHCFYVYPMIYYYYHKVCIYGIFGVGFVDARSLQITLYAIIMCLFLKKLSQYEKKNNSNSSSSILSIPGK